MQRAYDVLTAAEQAERELMAAKDALERIYLLNEKLPCLIQLSREQDYGFAMVRELFRLPTFWDSTTKKDLEK